MVGFLFGELDPLLLDELVYVPVAAYAENFTPSSEGNLDGTDVVFLPGVSLLVPDVLWRLAGSESRVSLRIHSQTQIVGTLRLRLIFNPFFSLCAKLRDLVAPPG